MSRVLAFPSLRLLCGSYVGQRRDAKDYFPGRTWSARTSGSSQRDHHGQPGQRVGAAASFVVRRRRTSHPVTQERLG